MGHTVYCGEQNFFYLPGWNVYNFLVFHGKHVREVIPLCRKKLIKMHADLLCRKIPIEHPSEDPNWWFAVEKNGTVCTFFDNDRKKSVEYHTMLAFYTKLCNGIPFLYNGSIRIEDVDRLIRQSGCEYDPDVDPTDVDPDVDPTDDDDESDDDESDNDESDADSTCEVQSESHEVYEVKRVDDDVVYISDDISDDVVYISDDISDGEEKGDDQPGMEDQPGSSELHDGNSTTEPCESEDEYDYSPEYDCKYDSEYDSEDDIEDSVG